MLANFGGLAPSNPLPQYGFFSGDILKPLIQGYLTGTIGSAQEALEQAQIEVTQYLQDEGVI
jgi:hypothetical protein